jgi:hypothetical protein
MYDTFRICLRKLAHQHDRGAATYKRITPIAPAPFQFSICRTARRRRRPIQVGEKDQPLICWTTSLATAVAFCSAGLVPVRLHVEISVGWHAVTVNEPVTASGPLQQQLAGSVASQPKHRCVASPIVPFIFTPQIMIGATVRLPHCAMRHLVQFDERGVSSEWGLHGSRPFVRC